MIALSVLPFIMNYGCGLLGIRFFVEGEVARWLMEIVNYAVQLEI